MKELDGRLIEGVTFEVSVPELGYFDKKDQKFVKMDLPKTNSGEEKTLQIIARHDNRPFFYAFLPIKGKRIGQEGDFRWYELGNPTREFSERVIDYRRQIYTNSHNQTR
jgi:hypothetical protein